MTPDQIERLAASATDMPEDLPIHEQLLFLTFRLLYQNYNSGAVNKERAKREKQLILKSYDLLMLDVRIMEQSKAIRKRMGYNIYKLRNCGCDNCKKLLDMFDGLERYDIPADLVEANDRLRELVKKRSERNAQLVTLIDGAKRALERNDIERVREILNA
jgi:hypothetical protein